MYSHLTKSTKAVLNKSKEQKIKHISQEYWIDYPIANHILEKMENIYKYGPGKIRTISILLVGNSNNGKTSLLQEFIKKHPPYDYNIEEFSGGKLEENFFDKYTGMGIPIIYTIAPTEPSENRLYNTILEQLNIPYKYRDTTDSKSALVQHYFKLLNVRILIIDEIHNILNGSNARQRQTMSAIRDLSSKLKMPIILSGVKEALRAINTEEQISSRYRPEYLTKWKMDQNYVNLLATIIKRLPLKQKSTILNPKDAKEILEISGGYIGEIINLIKSAAMYAIENDIEQVTINEIHKCDFNNIKNVYKKINLADI